MKTKMDRNQKERILRMLNRHYEIDKNVELLIRTIASNEEELQDLQILAFAVVSNEKGVKEHTVSIKTNNPILLVKAIKDVCNVPLKEAKDIVDSMRAKETFTLEEFSITISQWDMIVDMCKNDLNVK